VKNIKRFEKVGLAVNILDTDIAWITIVGTTSIGNYIYPTFV